MRVQETEVHCIACKHEWLAETIVAAPIAVWSASVTALRCPTCGAGPKNIAFGRGDVPDPLPIQDGMTDPEKRVAWLKTHDNGRSSECIAEKMCGLVPNGNYPHDVGDFGRCERLLILYPEWRARFDEMKEVNATWNALVERWDEIAEAWRHDVELYRVTPRVKGGWRCDDLLRGIVGDFGRLR